MTREIDVKELFCKLNKNKYVVPVILILIAVSFSTYLRMFPSSLPITDTWAVSVIKNNFYQQVKPSLKQQYPNLPEANLNSLAGSEWIKYQQTDEYKQAIAYVSPKLKSYMQDEQGYTYLLEIDPYLWYSKMRDILGIGEYSIVELRNGRLDKQQAFNLHPYFAVATYKFMHFFNSGITPMRALFLMPVIIIALALIPAFFLTRKIAGNLGGFFAMMLIILDKTLLSRTPAGFADTDSYNILMPLYIIWIFMFAWTTKNTKNKIILSALAGLLIGLYRCVWSGGGYMLILLAGVLFIYAFIQAVQKKSFLSHLYILTVMFISSFLTVILLGSFEYFWQGIYAVIKFPFIKEVATKTIWPNVLTTVAEFNEVAFTKVFAQLGVAYFYILISLGLGILIWKKELKYALLFSVGFFATIYSFSQGVRFSILAVPFFAILVGLGVGLISKPITDFAEKSIHISGYISKPIISVVFLLLLITPLNNAKQIATGEIPLFNDAWYNTTRAIHDDCKDGIITSWWDYGHMFTAFAERRVTFDGGDQKWRIHWVGKTLYTNNETEAINILKMLNCGQNSYYNKLVEEGMAEKEAIETIYSYLAEENYSFCSELLPQYFIVSEDMIGKSGVWAHFGSWDFAKAQLWQDVRAGRPVEIDENTKHEIINTEADKWISDWPTYNNIISCPKLNKTIDCNELKIDLVNMEAYLPDGTRPKNFVYADNQSFYKKEYNSAQSFGIGLLPDGSVLIMDGRLSGSMFTRLFFYGGVGLEHFRLFQHDIEFTGGDIITYKVIFE